VQGDDFAAGSGFQAGVTAAEADAHREAPTPANDVSALEFLHLPAPVLELVDQSA